MTFFITLYVILVAFFSVLTWYGEYQRDVVKHSVFPVGVYVFGALVQFATFAGVPLLLWWLV